jgi:hypothetical protein
LDWKRLGNAALDEQDNNTYGNKVSYKCGLYLECNRHCVATVVPTSPVEQVGQIVHHVIAMDPDDKPVLRYHIDAENSEARSEEGTIIKSSEYDYMSLFDLNPLDGQLRVVKLLDRERVETVRLGIRVEDLAASKEKQISSGRTKYH